MCVEREAEVGVFMVSHLDVLHVLKEVRLWITVVSELN